MVYEYIQAREIIANVYNDFNIQTTDWEIRAIEWIGKALNLMNIYLALTPCSKDVEVIGFRAKVPCDIKSLKAIESLDYNIRLVNSYAVNKHEKDFQSQKVTEYIYYTLDKNGYAHFGFETGTVRFHYLKLPTYYDNQLNAEIPLVPNEENTKEAIAYFILYKLLSRGYNHPVFSLNSPNPVLNPYQMWRHYKAKARNKVNSLNYDMRKLHSDMWTSLVKNLEADKNSFYDNNPKDTN